MKLSLKGINLPTPLFIRRIANSIMASCSFIAGFSIISDYKVMGAIALAGGLISKFISDFFHEDSSDADNK
jgi:hypothetical protein